MSNLRELMRNFPVLFCLVLSSAIFAEQPSQQELDAYVAKAMKTFEVPGMAISVVKDGKVVLAKGYGIRKMGDTSPVDSQTLFGIASNTKAFTATALAMLVEEGKIEWDKPVVTYLPWFAMWDPWVTRELTVRDLLVHRSGLGLGAGDLLWWPETRYDRKEIARRLRFIKPATSFRSTYAYDNVLYVVAGEVIEAVSGQSWEDFVATRILRRVGMTHTNTSHTFASTDKNAASPHGLVEGVVRKVTPFTGSSTNPAGGINSCAEDMAKWLLVLLSKGELFDKTKLFKEDSWKNLSSIVTPMPIANVPSELSAIKPNFAGYALGLGIQDYRGHQVVTHRGALTGYVSRVYMVPDQSLGIVILTNQEVSDAYDAIIYYIVDNYLDAPTHDWIAAYKKVLQDEKAKNEEAVKTAVANRNKNSKPSLPLNDYAKTYEDDWYGKISVTVEKGGLVMRFDATPVLVGDLEHWQYDTFIVRWRDRELKADAFITFSLNADGKIDHATMKAVAPDTDFSFDFQDLYLKPRVSPKLP